MESKTLKLWGEKYRRISFWPWGKEEFLKQDTKNNHKKRLINLAIKITPNHQR